jgi:hypothetical protein
MTLERSIFIITPLIVDNCGNSPLKMLALSMHKLSLSSGPIAKLNNHHKSNGSYQSVQKQG